MPFQIHNRRYTGSKHKLKDWILDLALSHCKGTVFCDLFAGTGVISATAIQNYQHVIINDLLYSNNLVYQAFFLQESYSIQKIQEFTLQFQKLTMPLVSCHFEENYFHKSFGGKFFSDNDAKVIGYIRETLEVNKHFLNKKEYAILLASLLYSADRSANTVGHYDAFFHKKELQDRFQFELIEPIILDSQQKVRLHREDSNVLAKKLESDIVYIDPPYNSRQYSRFYHVLENLTQWKKPKLSGVALKPPQENMSDYCRSNATQVFRILIRDLQCPYIMVSYNNTYRSKSNSSKNKIALAEIERTLAEYGRVQVFEKEHAFFNTGKTDFTQHKEYLFILAKGKI